MQRRAWTTQRFSMQGPYTRFLIKIDSGVRSVHFWRKKRVLAKIDSKYGLCQFWCQGQMQNNASPLDGAIFHDHTHTHTEWILIESKWRTISPYPDAEPMPLVSGFVGQACFCFPRICIVLQEVAGNMHRLYSSLLWPNCLLPFTHSAASSTFIGFADLL